MSLFEFYNFNCRIVEIARMNEELNMKNNFHGEINKMSDYYSRFSVILRNNFEEM